jgi:hypothetical protein
MGGDIWMIQGVPLCSSISFPIRYILEDCRHWVDGRIFWQPDKSGQNHVVGKSNLLVLENPDRLRHLAAGTAEHRTASGGIW